MKIKNVLTTAVLIGTLMVAGISTAAAFDQNTPITTTHGNITGAQIAEIQPGLGTVMREYAHRFWAIFYAAKSGNWDLAQYQLKEAREIQEVGETTRSSRAPMLKAFEANYLNPLQDTMNLTDWNAFQTAYYNAVDGCNNCHAANGFSYIKYTLPSDPPDLLFTPAGVATDSLVSGYNLIALSIIPDPTIYAKNLLYTTTGGIPGVTKVMRWNPSAQQWEGYEYIVADGIYLGNNFTMDGYKAYFIKGNASTAGDIYTFQGRR